MQNYKKLGIYIHWPFCKSKCPYCDFYKMVSHNENQEEIIDSYIDDLNFYRNFLDSHKVCSIFFGGGTPSLIKPQLIEKILNYITTKFTVLSTPEISLEANPNSNKQNLFSDLKSAGINRLSLGVQSFDDDDLHFLGRSHNSYQAKQSLSEILKIFDNHSIDLIYALPQQDTEKWLSQLSFASAVGLRHISLYQLTIEDGTVFQKKNIKTLDEESAAKMYSETEKFLKTKKYAKYEVSNFAQNGFESIHNLLYWQGDDYIGIGESAHGRIGLTATEHQRKIINLSPQERAVELIIMGLRITQGIDKNKFFEVCKIKFDDFINTQFLNIAEKEHLLINSTDNLRATHKGFLILNYLIENLCP